MLSKAEQEEDGVFELFLDLPPELRKLIIDRMRPEDIFKFATCSKLCRKEGKASKNYLYRLGISIEDEDEVSIFVEHHSYKIEHYRRRRGYSLKFETNHEGKTYMKYYRLDGFPELWKIELSTSKNPIELATERFKEFMKIHQNNIKILTIESRIENLNLDFEITNLNSLEILKIDSWVNHINLISKIRKPLKTLEVCGPRSIIPLEMIYEVYYKVRMFRLKLNYQQFLLMVQPKVLIDIGEITESEISSFIKNWLEGRDKERSKNQAKYSYWFQLRDSNFDKTKFYRFLGITEKSYKFQHVPHRILRYKHATVFSSNFELHVAFRNYPSIEVTSHE